MVPLVMIRDSLKDLPVLEVPTDYSIRTFRPGDECEWERIVACSFETPRTFNQIMREDPSYAPERIFFAVKDGIPVATAAAWYHPLWGGQYGYLHFVGVEPAHRGNRLGYWLSLAALHRFVAEGRAMAALETEHFRVPAIKTYLRLGFRPQLSGDSRGTWRRLSQRYGFALDLNESSWIEQFTDRQ